MPNLVTIGYLVYIASKCCRKPIYLFLNESLVCMSNYYYLFLWNIAAFADSSIIEGRWIGEEPQALPLWKDTKAAVAGAGADYAAAIGHGRGQHCPGCHKSRAVLLRLFPEYLMRQLTLEKNWLIFCADWTIGKIFLWRKSTCFTTLLYNRLSKLQYDILYGKIKQ